MGNSERAEILKDADRLTHEDRDAVYGDPLIGMRCAAELKAIYRHFAAGRYSREHDEAIERNLEKLARIATGTFHRDNYVDGAAYLAMAGKLETRAPQEAIAAFLVTTDALTPSQLNELKTKWNQPKRAHDYLELNTSRESRPEINSLEQSAVGPKHPQDTQNNGGEK